MGEFGAASFDERVACLDVSRSLTVAALASIMSQTGAGRDNMSLHSCGS